ncbi:MAG TPA: hypothetical protein VMF52_17595 [Steroidobacteraceae bacterium]|nr:hypothetical protein [Steroidobacteraceae bacterium]
MGIVYLAGHGSWDIKSGGFARVPRNRTVTFYTEAMKNMFTTDMFDIIGGTYQGEVKQFYEPGQQVPNYTLHPDLLNEPRCNQLLAARNDPGISLVMLQQGVTLTLQQIMDTVPTGTNLIWCACRHTQLKDVGGKKIGVNGAQGSYGNRDNQGNLGAGDIFFNPTNANSPVTRGGVDTTSQIEYAMNSRRKAMGYDD